MQTDQKRFSRQTKNFPERSKFKQFIIKVFTFFLAYRWTLNIIGPFAKKLENLLVSENVVIRQSFFHVSWFELTHFIRAHSCISKCQTEIAEWLLENTWLLSYLWIAFSVDVCFVNSCLPGTLSPGTVGFCLIPKETEIHKYWVKYR